MHFNCSEWLRIGSLLLSPYSLSEATSLLSLFVIGGCQAHMQHVWIKLWPQSPFQFLSYHSPFLLVNFMISLLKIFLLFLWDFPTMRFVHVHPCSRTHPGNNTNWVQKVIISGEHAAFLSWPRLLDSGWFFFIFISPPSDFIISFSFAPGQKSVMPVYHLFFYPSTSFYATLFPLPLYCV